jgi:hypothetical protein
LLVSKVSGEDQAHDSSVLLWVTIALTVFSGSLLVLVYIPSLWLGSLIMGIPAALALLRDMPTVIERFLD